MMTDLELFKKLTIINRKLKKLREFDFENISIRINSKLEKQDQIQYSFNILKIPFEIHHPNKEISPEFINVSFNSYVNLNVIYYITSILDIIYAGNLGVYIHYIIEDNEPDEDGFIYEYPSEPKIFCGGYQNKESELLNFSKRIDSSEILNLDIENFYWGSFEELFPNEDYCENESKEYKRRRQQREWEKDDEIDEKNDRERDNFDALTDGQYGNYDDWRDEGGDFDSLRDKLGL